MKRVEVYELFEEFIKHHTPNFDYAYEGKKELWFCLDIRCENCKINNICPGWKGEIPEIPFLLQESIIKVKENYPEYLI